MTHLWPFDRAVRVSGGVFLFATPALNFHTYPWNLLGLAVMLTGFLGFCPLYELVARTRALFAESERRPNVPLRSAGH